MIFYNAWDLNHKKPFGAVPVGTEVFFSIIADQCSAAYLCTDTMGEFKMEQDGSRFSFSLRPDKLGLIFYFFRVFTDQGIPVFLNKHTGGESCCSSNVTEKFQLTVYPKRPPLPSWYTQGIAYQIFPDRFAISGGVQSPKPNSFLYGSWEDKPMYIKQDGNVVRWDFFGGNLKGIQEKLPYLKDLNVTVLYLNPIFESSSNHRYSTGDYSKIDPMLGTLEDFQNLVSQAEKIGIKIILDGVFNHTGADSFSFNKFGRYPTTGAYQSTDSPYYSWYHFRHFPDDYESWWGVGDLPRLNTECPDVVEYLITGENSIIKQWTKTGIGGWRLDVADELPDCFLRLIHQTTNEINDKAVILGEVWEDASNKVAYGVRKTYFTEFELDCVMNYPFRNHILAFLRHEISSKELETRFMTQMENYPLENFMGNLNLLSSHDVERILTIVQSINQDHCFQLLEQLVFLQFCFPGVPCIYYGDEAGVEGGKDPDNRRTYPWGRENKQILDLYHRACQMRATHDILKQGATRFFSYEADIFGVIRLLDQQQFGIFINRSDKEISFPYQEDFITVAPFGYTFHKKT